jgi:hypothetical protein
MGYAKNNRLKSMLSLNPTNTKIELKIIFDFRNKKNVNGCYHQPEQ